MMKKKILYLSLAHLRKSFIQDLPVLAGYAGRHDTPEQFRKEIQGWLEDLLFRHEEGINETAARRILRLLAYEGTAVQELSTGAELTVRTFEWLWKFLRNELDEPLSPDLFIDLYHQFRLLRGFTEIIPGKTQVRHFMKRWPSGLEPEVREVQEQNKERIIRGLIRKIEKWQAPTSRYQFPEGMSYDEKIAQVNEWWQSARFHLTLAIKSPTELNTFLGNTLSGETMQVLLRARKKGIPFFITPYYLTLLNTGPEGYNDATVRSYILYSEELVDTYGQIKAWEKEDEVEPGKPNAAGWILPEGNNIHRRYPEVAILIPDSMGRACGGLCSSCQRMYDFQSQRLNFDLESLKPKETWEKKLRRLMHYFEFDPELRDILITGGDALMSQNATLRKILEAVYKMAYRKKKANEERPSGEKFAELTRVRLGTRLLAYLPLRITGELVEILREFREKAYVIGVRQFIIQTHFQSPLEVTPAAREAVLALQSAGWTITNQLVFTVAASRRGHTARLRQVLNEIGIICYYTFSVKGFQENYAMFTPNSRSLQEQQEEKRFGKITPEIAPVLHELIRDNHRVGKTLTHFLKESNLLFAGTDRNVLNLPAIGKSMTFALVGWTADGKRILKFDHDKGRRHSPVINTMGEVYIVENKSVGAYLRQLREMGEDLTEYRTIWNYCESETEPRFQLFEYVKR